MRTSSYPRLVRRRSTLHGWGVFALDSITKNTRIVQYAGEKIAAGGSKAREADQLRRGHIWCFSVNRRWVRDAEVGGNIAKYINHACRPNCYSQVIGDTDLDPGRTQHPEGRGTQLQLLHQRLGGHSLQLRARLQEHALNVGPWYERRALVRRTSMTP